jgi:hypothetical protein
MMELLVLYVQQPPFSCTKSSYGSKKFSTKQNSLSTSADSAYCQAIVYLTEAIIFHGQCFWVEKFSTSTAYGTKVLCLTEVSLLVHGQYLHGSNSFCTIIIYWVVSTARKNFFQRNLRSKCQMVVPR